MMRHPQARSVSPPDGGVTIAPVRDRNGRPEVYPVPERAHRLSVRGELCHDTAAALEAKIDALSASGIELLILDLRRLRSIDETGVRVIALRCGLCRRRGLRIELIRGNAEVQAGFAAAGLADALPFREQPGRAAAPRRSAGPIPV
jgi:anti-anti-sigma factor